MVCLLHLARTRHAGYPGQPSERTNYDRARVNEGTLNCLEDATLASVSRYVNLLQKERFLPD